MLRSDARANSGDIVVVVAVATWQSPEKNKQQQQLPGFVLSPFGDPQRIAEA